MLAMAESFGELGQRYEADPQAYARYTPPQLAFLGDPSPRKGFVGANQVGKTFTGGEDSLGRMRGRHPVLGRWRPVPVHGWCVNSSWKQSLVIQRKVWELLAPGELAPGVRYTHKRGFTGSYIELRNGSTLTFVTANQDTIDLASATLDFIWVDEPPHEHIWGELVARVRKRRGVIFLTMTPIGRPVDWLRLGLLAMANRALGEQLDEARAEVERLRAQLDARRLQPSLTRASGGGGQRG